MFDAVEKILASHNEIARKGDPQGAGAINDAEHRLGVMFPESFREYLRRWGGLTFGGTEYMGLGARVRNVVEETRDARAWSLPMNLVVVCDHDGDEYVCLDVSAMTEGECPVVIWDTPTRTISRTRASSFERFLETDLFDPR